MEKIISKRRSPFVFMSSLWGGPPRWTHNGLEPSSVKIYKEHWYLEKVTTRVCPRGPRKQTWVEFFLFVKFSACPKTILAPNSVIS